MTDEVKQFDPIKYKETTTEQWQTAAEPWYRWGPTVEDWLGQPVLRHLDVLNPLAVEPPEAIALLGVERAVEFHSNGIVDIPGYASLR